MNFKRLSILLLFIAFGINGFAQAREDNRRPSPIKTEKKFDGFDLDKVVVGGNFGAQFGNRTVVNLSPTIGYKFTENWLVGLGAKYIYLQEKFLVSPTRTVTLSTNIYGAGPFSQYYFFENFIAHVEYEYLNREDFNNPDQRVGVNSFLIGGGYRSPIGGNSFVNLLLLYNLNETVNSPYSNPILRISFGIGL